MPERVSVAILALVAMHPVWGFLTAVVLLCTGCGGAVSTPPPKPPSVQRGLVVTDPSTIPLELGERLIAGAEVMGMSIGTLDMRVTRLCGEIPNPAWAIDAKLGTAGILRWFNKTQGHTTTYFDRNTLQPIRTTTLVVDGDDWRHYAIDFKPGRYSYVYEKSNGDKKTGEGESPQSEPIYDTQTAYALLRSWHPKPKEKTYYYLVLGKDLWRADVQFRGMKTVEFGDDKVRVLVLDGLAHRIDLKPGDEYSPRKFGLWLTADEHRVPIKVVGDGSLGSVHFDLDRREVSDECREDKASAGSAKPKTEEPAGTATARRDTESPRTDAAAAGTSTDAGKAEAAPHAAARPAAVEAEETQATPPEDVAAADPVSSPPVDGPSPREMQPPAAEPAPESDGE